MVAFALISKRSQPARETRRPGVMRRHRFGTRARKKRKPV